MYWLSQSLTLNAGSYQTMYVLGALANLNTLMTVDHLRRVATEAKLRIIQGSPSSGAVDVYLTAPGAGIAAASPLFPAMGFGRGYGTFKASWQAPYDLTVTRRRVHRRCSSDRRRSRLENSGIYTAAARDAPGRRSAVRAHPAR